MFEPIQSIQQNVPLSFASWLTLSAKPDLEYSTKVILVSGNSSAFSYKEVQIPRSANFAKSAGKLFQVVFPHALLMADNL
jgi:hypothetical protein